MSATATIRPLSAELQKVAIEELHEVPERVEQDLKDFREWIEKQPHLNARTDDQFLLCFLRGCKYSLEKSKSKIDKYYTLKTKYPDFYTIQNVDDPRVMELVKIGVGVNLPTPLNENGPRIQYVRTGSYPTDKFTFADVMCVANALQEVAMRNDDYCVVQGYIQILDFANYSTGHMLNMTPTVFKKMSVFAEDAVPLRQKEIHVINPPSFFEKLFNMLKPFMPAKQQERMFVHGSNLDEFYKHIPRKYLPKELGGENSSVSELIQASVDLLENNRDYFIEDRKFGVNEKLRQGESVDYDSVFGVVGSFRKLDVD